MDKKIWESAAHLGIVANLVAGLHAEPLGQRAILLGGLGQLALNFSGNYFRDEG